MSFGAQAFVKGTQFDVINSMLPTYILDLIIVGGSGSRSYSVPEGKTLKAQYHFGAYYPFSAFVSVSGNTVTWGNLGAENEARIFVYAD